MDWLDFVALGMLVLVVCIGVVYYGYRFIKLERIDKKEVLAIGSVAAGMVTAFVTLSYLVGKVVYLLFKF